MLWSFARGARGRAVCLPPGTTPRSFSSRRTLLTSSPSFSLASDRLRIDPKEHPLLIAEPTVQGDADRERMVELAFEGHGTPAVFLSRAAVLASFATGRPTAVVVDMGHEATTGELVFGSRRQGVDEGTKKRSLGLQCFFLGGGGGGAFFFPGAGAPPFPCFWLLVMHSASLCVHGGGGGRDREPVFPGSSTPTLADAGSCLQDERDVCLRSSPTRTPPRLLLPASPRSEASRCSA